ncbi:ubiquitin-conjugating enzyme E2-22 kDa-like [Sycon ciliatum]|uniref:ubiquitin-conjugating enzyme E2-22 kDa-like n=1 Tax=Sycon ciliatum TaxID=27933 RepID=UPI0020A969E0|eukprot:scpid89082/ scgid13337/ Ubiquitin-conjugating enzyme E2-22 kDa; Ubiquitin carrier protein; Ubiquitin-protein ligase
MVDFTAATRIQREFRDVMKSKECADSNIKIVMLNDNYSDLRGEFLGPPDTPFAGGTFNLEIRIPDGYPFEPPKVRFTTRIWHPNISSATGAICLDILKDQWAAAMNLRVVLLSIQGLLASPEPDDPQDAVVAKQYKQCKPMYSDTARYWTCAYAGGPQDGFDYGTFSSKVQRMMEMGISESNAVAQLSAYNWNLEHAIGALFS